jgi:hypothetical protein
VPSACGSVLGVAPERLKLLGGVGIGHPAVDDLSEAHGAFAVRRGPSSGSAARRRLFPVGAEV